MMTMTPATATRPPAPMPAMAPRFFVRTVGPRFHVVDDASGFTVSAFWSLRDATADSNRRNGWS